MRAWPFLKSASPDLDYRVVAAPEFVCNANQEIRQHFAKAIPDTYVPFDEVLRCQWQPPTLEINGGKPFDIIYRMVRATRQHLGEESDAPLHDNVGREIRIIEGLIFERTVKEVTHQHLDIAHKAILPLFQEFFPRKTWTPTKSEELNIQLKKMLTETTPVVAGVEQIANNSSAKSLADTCNKAKQVVKKPRQTNWVAFAAVTAIGLGVFIAAYRYFKRSPKAKEHSEHNELKS